MFRSGEPPEKKLSELFFPILKRIFEQKSTILVTLKAPAGEASL